MYYMFIIQFDILLKGFMKLLQEKISNVAIIPMGNLVFNYVPLELDKKYRNSQHARSALCREVHYGEVQRQKSEMLG